MGEQIIAAITRHAADAVSRRASLQVLGGMALAAVTAVPAAAKGGKGGKKRKKRKGSDGGSGNAGEQLTQARCASQVEPCRTSWTAVCRGNAECLAHLSCCDSFATCDGVGAVICLFSA
jgi:hypothetical protein